MVSTFWTPGAIDVVLGWGLALTTARADENGFLLRASLEESDDDYAPAVDDMMGRHSCYLLCYVYLWFYARSAFRWAEIGDKYMQ
jgi:hypothetical protein